MAGCRECTNANENGGVVTHPYTVTVTDATGRRIHPFSALHQAETFYNALQADAAMAGHTIRLELRIREKVVRKC